ncbi:hypothetical protein [Chitinophaga varians]|uniref:hypothetical protein n=1 Tax=Chitinophaga varians TaxID=2202339 RepID=UPI00165EDD2D|nr:hypothetical protein [Chitinophaga varians]MBC9915025.1 hypothetical protein [Chitinophaga varians]
MKIYSVICRFMLAALFVLICSNVNAQTINNKLIGVSYKEASVLNEQVTKLFNLIIIHRPDLIVEGTYLQYFNDATDSSRVNLNIRYAVNPETKLVGEVLIYGNKDYLAKIYKTFFDKKFAPKNPNSVLADVVRGNEYISINTNFDDGNIRIEEKGK